MGLLILSLTWGALEAWSGSAFGSGRVNAKKQRQSRCDSVLYTQGPWSSLPNNKTTGWRGLLRNQQEPRIKICYLLIAILSWTHPTPPGKYTYLPAQWILYIQPGYRAHNRSAPKGYRVHWEASAEAHFPRGWA